MAFYIDYNKCYNGITQDVGKSNKIDRVELSIKKIESEEPSTIEVEQYVYDRQKKGYCSLATDKVFTFGRFINRETQVYTTKFSIVLSYDLYPELQSISNIEIDSISFKGKYADKITTIQDEYSIPLIGLEDFNESEISDVNYEEEEDASIKYSYVEKMLNHYKSYTPNVGDASLLNKYPTIKLLKKDNYCIAEVEVATKIAGIGLYKLLLHQYCAEFSKMKINLRYTPITISDESFTNVYGDIDGKFIFESTSQFLAENNTYKGANYNSYYASTILAHLSEGKNTLSITVPVSNFEIESTGASTLEEGDKCYIVKKTGEGIKIVTEDFQIQTNQIIPNSETEFVVEGLKPYVDTLFTGRIYLTVALDDGVYFDYTDEPLPIKIKVGEYTDEGWNVTETFMTISVSTDGGKIIVSTDDTDTADFCTSKCSIKQPSISFEHLFIDNNGNPILHNVIYQSVISNGMVLQNIELEPLTSSLDKEIYTNELNVVTGIKDKEKEQLTFLDIPYKINGYIIDEIGSNFVKGNNKIESIRFPFSLNRINSSAFAYTKGIRSPIVFNEGIISIASNAFNESSITGDLVIPEGLTNIGSRAFGDCKMLDGTLVVPSTVTLDSNHVFDGCKNLSKIIIYTDKISGPEIINDFDNTGSCKIYVLDSMLSTFKAKMPSHEYRIFPLSEMYE